MNILKVLATAALVTVLYNFLLFNTQPGIGFSLFIVFINWAVFILIDKNSKNPLLSYFFGLISSVFALLFSYRSNGIVQLIDILLAVFCLLLNIYFSKTNLKFDFSYINFLTAPLKSGLKFVEGIILSLTPQTWAEHSTQKHVTSSLLRGALIGVPVLAVFFIILSNADPIFANITFNFFQDIWIRTLLSFAAFISVLGLGITKIHETEKESEVHSVSSGKEYELLVILGGLALLFAGFIFIQFKYLFSDIGERELLNLGIKSLTYSEYVRKGFFELLLASVLSAGIVLYALHYIHKLKHRGKLLVQVFTSIVTIEVGMLLLSAAMRVNLYQLEHGLTRARVFGLFFLAWLAVLLIILLIKILKDINNKIYLSLNIVSTIIILLLMNYLNVDGLIANNEHKPTVNNEIDYYYLANLSPDAHESWIPAIRSAETANLSLRDKKDLSSEDYRILYWNLEAVQSISNHEDYLRDKYGPYDQAVARIAEAKKSMSPDYVKDFYGDKPLSEGTLQSRKWQSWNLGEYIAYQYIRDNSSEFDKLAPILKSLGDIRSRFNPEIIRTTILDRSTNAPLSN